MSALGRYLSRSDFSDPDTQGSVRNRPPGFFYNLGGNGPTHAGVRVDEATAQSVAAVFACWQVIYQTIASIPIVLYERTENSRQRAVNHELYSILHDEANSEQSAFDFWQTIAYHVVGWNFAVAELELNKRNAVKAIWPLMPSRTWVERKDGALWFWTWAGREGTVPIYKRLPADRVLYIRGLTYDGLAGPSIVRFARETIGQLMAAERYGAEFFANGAIPALALQHPRLLSPEAAKHIKASWQEAHGGLDRRHRLAVLEEGADLKVVGVDPEKSQLVEVQEFFLGQVCRFYRMPPHKVQDLRRATFSNIEHQDLEFHRDTMAPWYRNFEQAIKRQCLSRSEKSRYYPEFLVDALLRADSAGRAALHKALFEVGAASPNEIAARENFPPSGPEGDRRFFPLNYGPLDQADKLVAGKVRAAIDKLEAA